MLLFKRLEDQEEDFKKVKEILTSNLVVHFFDPSLKTQLLTDASRLKGLGFALIQRSESGGIRLIQCGSRSLTSAERNYATVELECLAIVYAVLKCRHFLLGMSHFEVITDHKPLLGAFAKSLDETSNQRIMRLREKLSGYSFALSWTAGKNTRDCRCPFPCSRLFC